MHMIAAGSSVEDQVALLQDNRLPARARHTNDIKQWCENQ